MASVNLRARSGNTVFIKFDGKSIGLCKSVRASDDYSPEPVSGIGDIHIAEYVPTVARHTLSVSSMMLLEGAMRDMGITPENADDMLVGKVFDISVVSNADGSELRKYMGCSYASGDVEVQANQVVVYNAQFNALNVSGYGM
jgi:hypothetical protein